MIAQAPPLPSQDRAEESAIAIILVGIGVIPILIALASMHGWGAEPTIGLLMLAGGIRAYFIYRRELERTSQRLRKRRGDIRWMRCS